MRMFSAGLERFPMSTMLDAQATGAGYGLRSKMETMDDTSQGLVWTRCSSRKAVIFG
jgi:hypothetical protein